MEVQVGVRRGQDVLEVEGRRSLPEIYTLLLIQPGNIIICLLIFFTFGVFFKTICIGLNRRVELRLVSVLVSKLKMET